MLTFQSAQQEAQEKTDNSIKSLTQTVGPLSGTVQHLQGEVAGIKLGQQVLEAGGI